jgi:hypothetical protein
VGERSSRVYGIALLMDYALMQIRRGGGTAFRSPLFRQQRYFTVLTFFTTILRAPVAAKSMKPSQNSLFKADTRVRSVAENGILGLVHGCNADGEMTGMS